MQARVRLCRVGVKKPAVVGVDEFVCMIVVLKEGELGWRSSARQFQEIERVSNQVPFGSEDESGRSVVNACRAVGGF